MDIKGKVEEIVAKIKTDKTLGEKFKKDPTGAVESLIGVDLPNEQLNQVVAAVKAKIDLDQLGSKLGGLFGGK